MFTTTKPSAELIKQCMSNPDNTRNVCILAHVDHGKTTIADALLATNRLVSKHMAGFIRYLDDRKDEQERGITMKSSAVSLLYNMSFACQDDSLLLLNLIDTPGHIDFSTEVAAALRVSDGAIIVVDLVEGVCAQTREAIKQAFDEHTKMILVLNKFDRLIIELHKEVQEIFQIIIRVVEDCNALVAEIYSYENLSSNEKDIEEADILFTPESGNVIFASALDGWGFTLKQIAEMFVDKIEGEDVSSLTTKMWNFDNYVDPKTKTVKKGANNFKKENLFVQLALKTVYYVYSTLVIRMERDNVDLICKKLQLKTMTREMKHNDPKIQARAILQAWNPLAHTIMLQCYERILSPNKIDEKRIRHLLQGKAGQFCEEEAYFEEVFQHFKNCSATSDNPTFVYISKMFCVSKKNMSQYKPKLFVPTRKKQLQEANGQAEETAAVNGKIVEVTKTQNGVLSNPLRTKNNENKSEKLENLQGDNHEDNNPDRVVKNKSEKPENVQVKNYENRKPEPTVENKNKESDAEPQNKNTEDKNAMIALARVFSGTIHIGQEFYLLPPFYRAGENRKLVKKVVVRELYILLGRDLVLVDSIEAGNICGIGGLENDILRTGTLSTTLNCWSIAESAALEPIVRNSIEPANPKDLPQLRRGLHLLMQSDSCVQVVIQESGEHVLLTAGDVHLAKCLEDLQTKFADIQINVSEPMVSLRETVVHASKKYNFLDDINSTVKVSILQLPFKIEVIAASLPEDIANAVRDNFDLLSGIENQRNKKVFNSETKQKTLAKLREKLKNIFISAKGPWPGLDEKIWSIGRSKDNLNVLLNLEADFHCSIFSVSDKNDIRLSFEHCIKNAFNSVCKAGPICEEPLLNCTFIIKSFVKDGDIENCLSPQTMANFELVMKNGFREAFRKQNQRLMEPIFTTDIQVNTSILGKVYGVVNKRHGKVLEAVGMDDQEKMYLVKAQIPVIESTGFANEIRKTTSGQAIPSLKFSHYEIIDGDPYSEPVSDDEDDDAPDLESGRRAYNLRRDVRRRKGLLIDDEVVVHAEKQRTLNKKK